MYTMMAFEISNPSEIKIVNYNTDLENSIDRENNRYSIVNWVMKL